MKKKRAAGNLAMSTKLMLELLFGERSGLFLYGTTQDKTKIIKLSESHVSAQDRGGDPSEVHFR